MKSCLFFLLAGSLAGQASYDLLLRGGHVIDAKNRLSAVRDVAIQDGPLPRSPSTSLRQKP